MFLEGKCGCVYEGCMIVLCVHVLVARLYFCHASSVKLSVVQSAILLGLGLQHKTVDQLEASGREGRGMERLV